MGINVGNIRKYLTVLLLVQALVLGAIVVTRAADRPPEPPRRLLVGDTVRVLSGRDTSGAPLRVPLANGSSWTLVGAFASLCGHCEKVAPAWAEWFANRPDVATLVISRDTPDSAAKYAARHGWRAQILSVRGFAPDGFERSLTSRTPWLFLFNPRGELVLAQHGGELYAVDSVLRSSKDGQ